MESELKNNLEYRLEEIRYNQKLKYMQTLRYLLLIGSALLLFVGLFLKIGSELSHIAALLVLISVLFQVMKFEFEKDLKIILEAILSNTKEK